MDRQVGVAEEWGRFAAGAEVIGILRFGSTVDGEGRDTDICIVAGTSEKESVISVLQHAWKSFGDTYDIWVFEELAVYMQDEVLTRHEVLWTEDKPALYEYLYPFRKLIADYHYRLKVVYDEI